MGLLLKTYRATQTNSCSAVSDLFDVVVINVPGPDQPKQWTPAVWLLREEGAAALVPIDGVSLRWGRPSGNFAGAIHDRSWLSAVRETGGPGCVLAQIYDQPPADGEAERAPEALDIPDVAASMASRNQTIEGNAVAFAEHLRLRLEAHGAADTDIMIAGVATGLARFIASVRGHAAVRQYFSGFVDAAEQYILRDAAPENEVMQ